MNWNHVEGKWTELKGKFRDRFAKLTDDDLTQARGKREQLIGKLRQRYGDAKDEAERKLDAFIATL